MDQSVNLVPSHRLPKLKRRITVASALECLGLSRNAKRHEAHRAWKDAVVDCRKRGDVEGETRWNAIWQHLRRNLRHLCDCGRVIPAASLRCRFCYMASKYGSFLGIFLLSTVGAVAQRWYDVRLTWKASPDTNVVGYYCYMGTKSRKYTSVGFPGNQLEFVMPNLMTGIRYFFAVTAFNAMDEQSAFSNEVEWMEADHYWTNAAYADGALADGDAVMGIDVTNNCVLTNNNLRLTGTWSNATWSGNVIAASGISGLLVSNLVFKATDNGLGLGYSNGFVALSISATDSEIRDSFITNLYYRYESTECSGQSVPVGIALNCVNATNVLVHNNTLDMIGNAIEVAYSGYSSNVQFYSNTITRVSQGFKVNTTAAGDAYRWRFWANSVNHLEAWNPMGGPCAGSYHNDCFILLNGSLGFDCTTNHGMTIDRNVFGPSVRVVSALLYAQPGNAWAYPDLLVANNQFLMDGYTIEPSAFCVLGISNVIYANNTVVSTDNTNHGTAFGAMPTSRLWNNLTLRVAQSVSHATPDGSYPDASDYNVWNGPWADGFAYPPFETFSDWKTHGFDGNSTTNAPTLTANYAPTLADTVARGMGTNLYSLGITTDFNGASRPIVGPWDIGAQNTSLSPGLVIGGHLILNGITIKAP